MVAGVGALVAPALVLRHPPETVRVGGGARIVRAGGATVVVLGAGRPDPEALLEGLRRAGVRQVDVVAAPGTVPDDITDALRHRWRVGAVIDGEAGPLDTMVGGVHVHVDGQGRVDVGVPQSSPAAAARGSPPPPGRGSGR